MYIIAEVILMTQRVKLIGKHDFVKAALNKNFETFVIYVAALEASKMIIHFSQIAQIAIM